MLRRSMILVALAAVVLPTAVAFAHGDGSTVADAVAHFAAIGKSLSEDSIEGVAAHADGMLEIMKEHEEMMAEGADHHGAMEKDTAEHMASAEDMEESHHAMRTALEALGAKDLKLEAARVGYKDLSKHFVPMAQMSYESRPVDPLWSVMSCPMAKAEWIQIDGTVANPFYGSKMLHCGKKVSDLAATGADEKHSKETDDDAEHSQHHGGGDR
jgi:hypothetical protein